MQTNSRLNPVPRSAFAVAGFLAVCVLAVCPWHTSAVATSESGSSEVSASGPDALNVSLAGMKVSIDPKTGRLRPPTKKEKAQLAAAMSEMFSRRNAAQAQTNSPQSSGRQSRSAKASGMLSTVVGSSHLRFTAVTQTERGLLREEFEDFKKASAFVEAAPPSTARDGR